MPSVLTKPPGPGEEVIRRTKTTTYDNRRAWLPWLLSLALVPLAIAALYLYPFGGRDRIQDDLSAKARERLSAAGISAGALSFNGNNASLCGVQPDLVDRAREAVRGLSGVGAVNVNDASCPPIGGPGTPTAKLGMRLQNGQLTLVGVVPDEATRAELAALAAASGRAVDNQLTVQAGATMPVPAADLNRIAGAMATTPGDRAIEFDGLRATLTGTAASDQDKANVQQQIAAIAPALTIDNQLLVAASALPPQKAALQQQINAVQQQAPIMFEPDSPVLTAQGGQTVLQIAALLLGVPDAAVAVNGHVAAVASPQDGQTLSEARANAVKDQLVEQGVATDKITARGFGDTQPIASNDTPEGQAMNRRVEIIVS